MELSKMNHKLNEAMFDYVISHDLEDIFKKALETNDRTTFDLLPKADLHIHGTRGCNREIFEYINHCKFPDVPRFKSLQEMDEWYNNTIDKYAKGKSGLAIRYTAMFNDFENQSITVAAPMLCLNMAKYFDNDIDMYIKFIKMLIKTHAPNTTILPEFSVHRGEEAEKVLENLERIKEYDFYKSICLQGDEKLGTKQYESVYKKAKEMGLILKAHVGEFTDASYIEEALEYLDLDCIIHGISLTESDDLMNYVRDHQIMINCCPSSNYYLSRIEDYKSHPIKEFVRKGIVCSLNTDDPLIFNNKLIDEYFELFNNEVLTSSELYEVNQNGLQKSLNKRR